MRKTGGDDVPKRCFGIYAIIWCIGSFGVTCGGRSDLLWTMFSHFEDQRITIDPIVDSQCGQTLEPKRNEEKT